MLPVELGTCQIQDQGISFHFIWERPTVCIQSETVPRGACVKHLILKVTVLRGKPGDEVAGGPSDRTRLCL